VDFVELLGRTGFFSFNNGVRNFEIKLVLILVPFLLETMWHVKLELLYFFELRIGRVRVRTLEIPQRSI